MLGIPVMDQAPAAHLEAVSPTSSTCCKVNVEHIFNEIVE
jgi:hypothetical protein